MDIFNWDNKVLEVLKPIIVQDSLTFLVPTSVRLLTFAYLSLCSIHDRSDNLCRYIG